MKDYELAAQELSALASEIGLVADWEFVPFSQSRNKGEKSPSLNWRFVLKKNGREVVAGDYAQGCAHAPAYKSSLNRYEKERAIAFECETGRRAALGCAPIRASGGLFHAPTLADLLSSLAMDSDAIDYATYEDWASNYGYEEDSRKGEAIYRACLETALKLRASIGEDRLQQLRELSGRM